MNKEFQSSSSQLEDKSNKNYNRWRDGMVNELAKFSKVSFITPDNLEQYKNEILEYLDDPDDFDMLSLPGLNYVYQTKRSFYIPYLSFEYMPSIWYKELFKYGILNLKNSKVKLLAKRVSYSIKEARKIQKEILENYMNNLSSN